MKTKFFFIFFLLPFLISSVFAARLPVVGGDDNTWGDVLNDFLNVSLTESGEIRPSNLTFSQKVTFAFGEIIDNIVDSWIRITGGLNVTDNLVVGGNLTIGNNTLFVDSNSTNVGIGTSTPTQRLDVNGSVAADYFIGDGSQLTGIEGGLIDSINLTSGTYTGAITNGSFLGYKAADTICNLEYSGSHFCTEFEVATWSSRTINSEDAWIIAGGPKFVPADIPVNDCNGWSHGSAGTYLGNYWHFNSTTGGDGRAIHCGTLLKLACCTN